MGNEVYANTMEVSCKAANGKSVCAFPDVCLSPPSPPAGPVPIPYPNTGMASDATEGSKTVSISGQEVMLKNKSYFKQSTGDEAATKSLGMGVVTHQIQGKVYFNSWSMDVKVEGENVVRHLDLTTHNHASFPGNSPTWPYLDNMSASKTNPCKADDDKEKSACKDFTPYGKTNACASLGKTKPSGKKPTANALGRADVLGDKAAANKCVRARRWRLKPYNPNKCCKPQTPHHLVEASAFFHTGHSGKGSEPLAGINTNASKAKHYKEQKAPCVCAEGVNQNTGTHGLMHAYQSASASKCKKFTTITITRRGEPRVIKHRSTTYGAAKESGIAAMEKVFSEAGCNKKCIETQLDNYHNQCGITDNTKIKAVETGGISEKEADAAVKARALRLKPMLKASGK